ncbi:diguanylate cyclase [Marinobacterium sp. D7]|uniref:GGDEF domain-containing protein n=1 Tax=Marinobacterium ramblicola TaxID=2849041 RepID=UPI001C2D080D|nr:GGDEF domain-containing protein [Marinobacterium ramblicola]MBV1787357.1 diguanylate cyclase [Marinobacterium ramblicola]
MKLRTKLTLLMLLVGVIAAMLVGGIAYWLLMRDFQQSVQDQAFDHFQADVRAYLSQYGSWENGVTREPFPLFVRRTRMQLPPLLNPGMPRPFDARGAHPGPLPGDTRPDPRAMMGGVGPEDGAGLARGGVAPFLFMLTDPSGRVVKPGGDFRSGEQIDDALRDSARPIEMDGRVVLLAVPLGDPNLTIQDLSYLAAMRNALGYGLVGASLLALLLGVLFSRRVCGRVYELISAVHAMRADGELEQEVPVRSKDEIGELAEAFNRMSRELAGAHAEMREAAVRDPLTQLHNRRYFNEQAALAFEQAVRYDQPLCVMIADLDHFKQINDTFSHGVGDEVLKRVAQLLQQSIRKSDILARHGGEEFVILFPQTSLQQAYERCEQLRQQIEASDWQQVHPNLRVTLSIGLNDTLALGSIEKMLSAADEALYAAKRAGRNRIEPAAA